MRPASPRLAAPTLKPTAPLNVSPSEPYTDSGITARLAGFQNRNACGSNSALVELFSPSEACARRLGLRRSETSKSDSCVPRRRPCVGRVLADAEQQVVGDRVQVGGVAEDLQLAEHLRGALARRGRACRAGRPGGTSRRSPCRRRSARRRSARPCRGRRRGRPATARAPLVSRTVTKLSLSRASVPSNHCGSSVEATRSAPSCSDSEYWLSTKPVTSPEPAYVVTLSLETSKRWIWVRIDSGSARPASAAAT